MFGFEFYLLFGVIGVVVAWTVIANGIKWVRQQRLKRKRQGQDRASFVRYFVVEGIAEGIAIEVYRYFQKLMLVKNFPVSPEDNLEHWYGLQDEDLTEAILELARLCRLPIPPENSPLWSRSYLFTVEDLVRFIAAFAEEDRLN
jgi:hypothetical protein